MDTPLIQVFKRGKNRHESNLRNKSSYTIISAFNDISKRSTVNDFLTIMYAADGSDSGGIWVYNEYNSDYRAFLSYLDLNAYITCQYAKCLIIGQTCYAGQVIHSTDGNSLVGKDRVVMVSSRDDQPSASTVWIDGVTPWGNGDHGAFIYAGFFARNWWIRYYDQKTVYGVASNMGNLNSPANLKSMFDAGVSSSQNNYVMGTNAIGQDTSPMVDGRADPQINDDGTHNYNRYSIAQNIYL